MVVHLHVPWFMKTTDWLIIIYLHVYVTCLPISNLSSTVVHYFSTGSSFLSFSHSWTVQNMHDDAWCMHAWSHSIQLCIFSLYNNVYNDRYCSIGCKLDILHALCVTHCDLDYRVSNTCMAIIAASFLKIQSLNKHKSNTCACMVKYIFIWLYASHPNAY